MDTPPSLSLLTINVLACANEVLVPCQTHPHAFSALDELFDTVAAVRQSINPQLKISGIIATFFDQRTRVSRRTLAKLKGDDRYRDLLFDTIIRVNTTIAESAEASEPIVFNRFGRAGASDDTQLARELLKHQTSIIEHHDG